MYAQQNNHYLYSFTILKQVKDGNINSEKLIEIDSLGNIFSDSKKTQKSVNVKTFSDEIRKFLAQEKVIKHPGNNDIVFIGNATPKKNKQSILISFSFFDEISKEKDFRNKTFYSWAKSSLSKKESDYSLFNYLNENEVNTLKALLQ